MTWAPTKQTVDLTQIVDNLLAYIDAQDADALEWANGDPGLAEFAGLYSNATGRVQTKFPQMVVLTQTIETDLAGDILIAGYQLVLETAVTGANADELATNTKIYGKAVESMLSNIPSATLTANSSPAITATLFELETRYDETRRLPTPGFIQLFQTRAVYRLMQAAY
jgi:TRAP-type mannitol/chloroaromatic compound transport system substrate-binding protein